MNKDRKENLHFVSSLIILTILAIVFAIVIIFVVPGEREEQRKEFVEDLKQIEEVNHTEIEEEIIPEDILIEEEVEQVSDLESNIKYFYCEKSFLANDIQDLCFKFGEMYSVSPYLLMAMIETESAGNPNAVSSCNAKGLMQIIEKWHKDRMEKLNCDDLFDAEQNVNVGTNYLAELFSKYEDDDLVLMIYNMGYKAAKEKYDAGSITYYARSILARAEELESYCE